MSPIIILPLLKHIEGCRVKGLRCQYSVFSQYHIQSSVIHLSWSSESLLMQFSPINCNFFKDKGACLTHFCILVPRTVLCVHWYYNCYHLLSPYFVSALSGRLYVAWFLLILTTPWGRQYGCVLCLRNWRSESLSNFPQGKEITKTKGRDQTPG